MQVAVWGAVSAAALGFGVPASADIYRYRDRSGTLVFTNAPATPAARLMRELPPAPRMLVPLTREAFLAELAKPVPPPIPTSYDRLIREIAERNNVEYALVKAVIKAESDFDRLAVSRKGALGLMQLMPETAAQHQVRDVFLPRDNIEGGCRTCACCSTGTGATCPSRSRPTTPAPGPARTRAASRPSPRRGSTWRACSATGWRTCGNERVSSPAADTVARGTRAAALPNLLTLVRVGLVPVLVVALLWSTPAARALAALAFLVACITDFLDGWLARRHGMTTALGQLLDPLADKLIVAAALIMLAAVPPEPRVPAWMVVGIVLRELAVTGLRR